MVQPAISILFTDGKQGFSTHLPFCRVQPESQLTDATQASGLRNLRHSDGSPEGSARQALSMPGVLLLVSLVRVSLS